MLVKQLPRESYPTNLTDMNGTLFFTLGSGELWRSDGTEEGTVKLSYGGVATQHLTHVNGTLFFAATDDIHGLELWKSDGTPEGTMLVKDVTPGTGHTVDIDYLTNLNGTLLFGRRFNTGLWKSDGTAAGTSPISNVSVSSPLTVVDDIAYFVGWDSAGAELWRSDGTSQGTYIVKDIGPGSNNSAWIYALTAAHGLLYFAATDGVNGSRLWRSDGTEAGTYAVEGIPTFASQLVIDLALPRHVASLTATDEAIYVIAPGELWRTDGTEAGTLRISGLPPATASTGHLPNSGYSNLTVAGNRVYFTVQLFGAGDFGPVELWVSDGTEAGTHAVDQIPPHYPGASFLTPVRDSLFFKADDGVHGTEVWVIPPTQAVNVIGDSNQDGRFDSSDLVTVFIAGKYEDEIPGNATFAEGDWNGDGDFDSGDLVFAFQAGTYVTAATPARVDIGSLLARTQVGARNKGQVAPTPSQSEHGSHQQLPTERRRHELDTVSLDRVFASLEPDPATAPGLTTPILESVDRIADELIVRRRKI